MWYVIFVFFTNVVKSILTIIKIKSMELDSLHQIA